MTTKRKRSQATSRDGINFVRTLVERHGPKSASRNSPLLTERGYP